MRLSLRAWPILLSALVLTACPGPQQTTNNNPVPPEVVETTWVRFVHAMSDAPAVDVSIGGVAVGSSIAYRQSGNWTEVPAGTVDIALTNGGVVTLDDRYALVANERYWIIAYGNLNATPDENLASLIIAPEEHTTFDENETYVRFVNAVAEGDSLGLMNVTGGSRQLMFPNQPVGTVGEWKFGPLYDAEWDIVLAADTSAGAVVDFQNRLELGRMYTIIVSGPASNYRMIVAEEAVADRL